MTAKHANAKAKAPHGRTPIAKKAPANNSLRSPLEQFAGHKVMRLLGYWVLVQTYGGWAGVAEQPFWSEGTIQRWRLEFFEVFGCHAEQYVPEVAPVLKEAFYGPAETHMTVQGKKAQDGALAILNAQKAAGKGRKG